MPEPRTTDVLFVMPPILLPRTFAHYPIFGNFGALCNAALAEREGLSVGVLDAFFEGPRLNLRPHGQHLNHVGLELEDLEVALQTRSPRVVVLVMTMFSDVHKPGETLVGQTASLIARTFPGVPLVAADCHVTGMNYFPYNPEVLLERLPDLTGVVLGEGDFKLLEVLRACLEGRSPEHVGGVWWRGPAGPVCYPGTWPLCKDLDSLPEPAFHLLNMDNYFSCLNDAVAASLVHEYHTPGRFLPLLTSRGCNFSCSFCTQQVLALPWRGHSNEYLERMISRLSKVWGVDVFMFLDNNINMNKPRFKRLVGFMSAQGLAWDAVNGFRADFLDEDDIALIKAAGNSKLTVSAESGDPAVLKGVVGKRLDLKHVVKVARACSEAGLPAQVHYVIGMPGEDLPAINRTLEFALMLYETHGAWPLLQHAIPFRGTGLFRTCEEHGWFLTHPDALPTHELEHRHLLWTPDFTPDEIMAFKIRFRGLLDSVARTAVLTLQLPDNNRDLLGEDPNQTISGAAPDPGELLARLETEHARGARALVITGGEPLLAAELVLTLIRRARQLGFRHVALVTNGRMLAYRELVLRLKAAGLDSVNVSLHSVAPEVHDRLTQVAGSHTQTLKGLGNLIHAGGLRVDVTMGITRTTLPLLRHSIGVLAGHGLRSFHLQSPVPAGRVLDHPDLIVPYPELLPALAELLRTFRDLELSVQGVPFCLLPPDVRDRARPMPFFMSPRLRPLKARHAQCAACADHLLCLGFWRERFEEQYCQMEVPGTKEQPAASGDGRPLVRLVGLFRRLSEPEAKDHFNPGGYIDTLTAAPYSLANACLKTWCEADPALADRYRLELLNLIDESGDGGLGSIEEVRLGRAEMARILEGAPAAVCFSCYCWNVDAALEACRRIKAAAPETVTVLGGRAVEGRDDLKAKETAVDFVITGEGEQAFAALLRSGLSQQPPPGEPVSDLDSIPSPFTAGLVPPSEDGLLMELSRGCPNTCAYCSWNSSKLRRRQGRGRIAADLKWAVESGARHVTFIDSAINYETAALEDLAAAVAEADPGGQLEFTYNVRHDALSPAHLAILKKIPTRQLLLGMESLSPAALLASNRSPLDTTAFEASVKALAEVRPPVIGVVLGLPGDTLEGFKATMEFLGGLADSAQPSPVGAVLVSLLQVFPGAGLRACAETGLETKRKGIPYLLGHPGFPAADLRRAVAWLQSFRLRRYCPVKGPEGLSAILGPDAQEMMSDGLRCLLLPLQEGMSVAGWRWVGTRAFRDGARVGEFSFQDGGGRLLQLEVADLAKGGPGNLPARESELAAHLSGLLARNLPADNPIS